MSALVLHQDSERLHVSSIDPLPRGARVELLVSGLTHSATVVSLHEADRSWDAELQVHPEGRLRERILIDGKASIECRNPEGDTLILRGTFKNRSAEGFQIEAEAGVDPGSIVRIFNDDAKVYGVVRYSMESRSSYLIGIERLARDSRSDPETTQT